MKSTILFIIGLFIPVLCGCQSSQENDSWLVINANIIDVALGSVRSENALIIERGQITALGKSSELLASEHNIDKSRIIDAQNGYLIPGLFDLHIHLRGGNRDQLKLMLFTGITTVRNMNGAEGNKDHIEIGRQVASGELLGPRYYTSTPYIENLLTEDNMVSSLNEYKKEGYHGVKVHGNMPLRLYRQLLKSADSLNFPVYGHAQRDKPLAESLQLKEITHVEEFLHLLDSSRWDEPDYLAPYLTQILESGVVVEPTLSIYQMINRYYDDAYMGDSDKFPFVDYINPNQRRRYIENNPYLASLNNPQIYDFAEQASGLTFTTKKELKTWAKRITRQGLKHLKLLTYQLHEAGVPMITGSDSFGLLPQGFGLHLELQNLQDAGISPADILKIATLNSARFMELHQLGEIEKGKTADFLILKENPLDDIKATLGIKGVFYKNHFYDEQVINRGLEEIKQSYR